MSSLVIIKDDEVFTDSMVIAEKTGNDHAVVAKQLKRYRLDFEEAGPIVFLVRKTRNKIGDGRGRPMKVYQLNEEQALLLMVYLGNTPLVRSFKKELIRQFVHMRKILMQRQTQSWQQARRYGVLTRKDETAMIKQLVEYAMAQGSKNAHMLYVVYTKLANKCAGVSKRDIADAGQIGQLAIIENIILHCIEEGIQLGKEYHAIYRDCKARLQDFQRIAYLQ